MAHRWLGGAASTLWDGMLTQAEESYTFSDPRHPVNRMTVADAQLPHVTLDLSDVILTDPVPEAQAIPVIVQWVVILGWPKATKPGEPVLGLRIANNPVDGCLNGHSEGVHGAEREQRLPGMYIATQCRPVVKYQLEFALWTSTNDDDPYNQITHSTIMAMAAKR